MRAKGKSMIAGSQNRLKRKGSIASSESGPPSWKSTTPIRRVVLAIPRVSLAEKDVTQNLEGSSTRGHGDEAGNLPVANVGSTGVKGDCHGGVSREHVGLQTSDLRGGGRGEAWGGEGGGEGGEKTEKRKKKIEKKNKSSPSVLLLTFFKSGV